MSIEYQLYSMSYTNQIIIPIISSKQNLEPDHPVSLLPAPFTPQKQSAHSEVISWKKSMSAFKKFKLKKDKKDKRAEYDQMKAEELLLESKREVVKLARIRVSDRKMISQIKNAQGVEINYSYFDPNQAPLYDCSSFEITACQEKEAVIKMEPEIEEIKLSEKQSVQLNQEQPLNIPNISQFRFDDPFIIIKKQHLKRTLKSNKIDPKTKIIKKDKVPSAKAKTKINHTVDTVMKDVKEQDQDNLEKQNKMAAENSYDHLSEEVWQKISDQLNNQENNSQNHSENCFNFKKEMTSLLKVMQEPKVKSEDIALKAVKQENNIVFD